MGKNNQHAGVTGKRRGLSRRARRSRPKPGLSRRKRARSRPRPGRESAETRTEQAETRTELAKTRTEKAEIRTEQAETRRNWQKADGASRDDPATCGQQRSSLEPGNLHPVPQKNSPASDRRPEKPARTVDGPSARDSPTHRRRPEHQRIAEILKVSPKTVEYHRMKLMDCLNIHDIPGLVRFALRVGLLPQEKLVTG